MPIFARFDRPRIRINNAASLRVSMLSTHPLPQERIDNLTHLAQTQGWASDGLRTPLPDVLKIADTKN